MAKAVGTLFFEFILNCDFSIYFEGFSCYSLLYRGRNCEEPLTEPVKVEGTNEAQEGTGSAYPMPFFGPYIVRAAVLPVGQATTDMTWESYVTYYNHLWFL